MNFLHRQTKVSPLNDETSNINDYKIKKHRINSYIKKVKLHSFNKQQETNVEYVRIIDYDVDNSTKKDLSHHNKRTKKIFAENHFVLNSDKKQSCDPCPNLEQKKLVNQNRRRRRQKRDNKNMEQHMLLSERKDLMTSPDEVAFVKKQVFVKKQKIDDEREIKCEQE
ncbi:unnamed protein product [Didymodactylos carnosus]|uniref:Uncharacterized protein n=1 Tax=Didymodactylos carnosus TaxID=1234261 RepID=A0A8S2IUS9_9BILA|nr:unnamed protein product [Didymodactylos carnosus]CAF3759854.1 unnamed protein product [Didymodactylos carnosus]